MQLFLVVGSLNSNTVDSPSLSDVGVLLAGEDDIKADAAGSVRWGFGLCWDQASRREKRLDCLAYLFSQSSSLFRSPGMSRLCNPMQSSGRGTGYVWNQLLLWRRWVLWMMNGSRHCGGMTKLRDTLARFDVRGGDAGGAIKIPVLFVLFYFCIFIREKFTSDIYKFNF